MSKWKLFFIGCGLLAPVVFAATYWATLESDAFAAATQYVKTAPEVTAAIGTVEKVGLEPFGYQIRMRDDGGHATLLLSVRGSTGKGLAKVFLERELRVWRVTEFRFNKDGEGK